LLPRRPPRRACPDRHHQRRWRSRRLPPACRRRRPTERRHAFSAPDAHSAAWPRHDGTRRSRVGAFVRSGAVAEGWRQRDRESEHEAGTAAVPGESAVRGASDSRDRVSSGTPGDTRRDRRARASTPRDGSTAPHATSRCATPTGDRAGEARMAAGGRVAFRAREWRSGELRSCRRPESRGTDARFALTLSIPFRLERAPDGRSPSSSQERSTLSRPSSCGS